MLIRDVTEVKRRDRALLSKDATIREIHHRVKNNLQTVAALLRLQARRTNNDEGREALMESVRRVAVDRPGARRAVDVGRRGGQPRRGDRPDPADHERRGPGRHARSGSTGRAALGVLDADRATALVMVITELVQNAIEHAFDAVGQAGLCDDSGRTLGALARRRGARRRPRPAGRASAWRNPTGWGCRSCGRWCRPNSTARWGCARSPAGAPTWCCGCRSAGGQARACRNSKCDVQYTRAKSTRPRHLPGPLLTCCEAGLRLRCGPGCERCGA